LDLSKPLKDSWRRFRAEASPRGTAHTAAVAVTFSAGMDALP
jgi:hypothetical protein